MSKFYTIYAITSMGAKNLHDLCLLYTFKVYGKILTTLLTTFSQFINHFFKRQCLEGFLRGESVPVNEKLSEIFLQLHISEKSGRGVPTIISTYGKDAIKINENSIIVTIPFNWINAVGNKVGNRVGNKALKENEKGDLTENRKKIISEIRNNPNITKEQLSMIIGISTTAIDKNLNYLKVNNYIQRVGSKKTGYWKVLD